VVRPCWAHKQKPPEGGCSIIAEAITSCRKRRWRRRRRLLSRRRQQEQRPWERRQKRRQRRSAQRQKQRLRQPAREPERQRERGPEQAPALLFCRRRPAQQLQPGSPIRAISSFQFSFCGEEQFPEIVTAAGMAALTEHQGLELLLLNRKLYPQ
jgi:hypothetical protein